MIQTMSDNHLAQIHQLWTTASNEPGWIFAQIDTDTIKTSFLRQENHRSFVYLVDDTVIGFVSGVALEDRQTAYISMIYVVKSYRNQAIATQLLSWFEEDIKSSFPSIKTIDLVFHNPVQFTWKIPQQEGHDHPNCPGVPYDSDAHLFFLSQGYQEFAIQDVYHQTIIDFVVPENVKNSAEQLQEDGIVLVPYDKDTQSGLEELFDQLHAPQWKMDVLQGLEKGYPLLVVTENDIVIGFAGPQFVQPSKRGYFAGIGVHPQYRGRRIASVLFTNLCAQLAEMGAEYMTLFTGRNNPAKKIYLQSGFCVVASFSNLRKTI